MFQKSFIAHVSKSFSEMHKKRFNETRVKSTTSETHNTRIKHVSNRSETSETEMKRMNHLKHGSWFAGMYAMLSQKHKVIGPKIE